MNLGEKTCLNYCCIKTEITNTNLLFWGGFAGDRSGTGRGIGSDRMALAAEGGQGTKDAGLAAACVTSPGQRLWWGPFVKRFGGCFVSVLFKLSCAAASGGQRCSSAGSLLPARVCWFPLGGRRRAHPGARCPRRSGGRGPGPRAPPQRGALRGVQGPGAGTRRLWVWCCVSSGRLPAPRQPWWPGRRVRSEAQPSLGGAWRPCPHAHCLACHPRLGLSKYLLNKGEAPSLCLLLVFLFCFDWFCYLLSFYVQNSHRESDGSVTI